MSVIHEAVKPARRSLQSNEKKISAAKSAPDLVVRAEKASGSLWIVWMLALFVIVEGLLLIWQSGKLSKTEEKLQRAYLELNDVRGEYHDAKLGRAQIAVKLANETDSLQKQLKEALRIKQELAAQKQAVEFENLNKEKTIAGLTRKVHESEMSKYQLQDEVQGLKKELERWSSPLPVEAQSSSKKS